MSAVNADTGGGPRHALGRCSEKKETRRCALLAGELPARGGILAALRRSPLVGEELDLTRPQMEGRPVDL
jgi:hypothetical protein